MSNYIAEQRQHEDEGRDFWQKMWQAIAQLKSLPDDALPPVDMMNIIGSNNRDHFLKASEEFFIEFVKRGKITPNSTILDIGSGCGRLALPFVEYLQNGSYYGCDIWKEGVEWCRANISQRQPSFQFEIVKANNDYYFGEYDSSQENDFKLDFMPVESVDFAFAISVFTHLVERDCRLYLREVCKTLKPTGLAYVTSFIVDKFFWEYRLRTGKHSSVKEIGDGSFQAYSGQDFFSGFSMLKWRDIVETSGLRVLSYETGSWAEKPGSRLFQDTFVCMRSDQF
jgi:SAM-dependent methyltransferase